MLCIGHSSLLLTGCIGSGKSTACNFFLKREAFKSKKSFKSVTTASASCTDKVGGKDIKFIDTKGFFDPCSSIITDELEELAKSIIEISDGIDAIGFVINLESRITKEDADLLQKLLETQSMIPYIFIIFTHAKVLGETERNQQQNIEERLKKDSPEILQKFVRKINGRFMLLESVEPMQEDYHDKKSHELLEVLQKLTDQNKEKFFFGKLTEQLNKMDDRDKIEVLKKDLEVIKQHLINKKDEPRFSLGQDSMPRSLPPTHSEALPSPPESAPQSFISLLPTVFNLVSHFFLQQSPVASVPHSYNPASLSGSILNPSLFQSQSSSNAPLDLFNPFSPANLPTTNDFLNKRH